MALLKQLDLSEIPLLLPGSKQATLDFQRPGSAQIPIMKTVHGHRRTHPHTYTLKWHVRCGEVIHSHPKPDAVIRKPHTMISVQLRTRKPKQRRRRTFTRRTSPALGSPHVCSRFLLFCSKIYDRFLSSGFNRAELIGECHLFPLDSYCLPQTPNQGVKQSDLWLKKNKTSERKTSAAI